MKIAFLRVPKNRFEVTPEKIVGVFAYENHWWKLYASEEIKRRLDKVNKIRARKCKGGKTTKARYVEFLLRHDFDWIKWVNDTLMWDFRPKIYAAGDIESMTASELERFKEVLGLIG